MEKVLLFDIDSTLLPGGNVAHRKALQAAMKEAYADRRIVCVFQPHTHDRTRKLYDDFTRCFTDADVVIIPNIYIARSDIETTTVDVDALVRDIAEKRNVECAYG